MFWVSINHQHIDGIPWLRFEFLWWNGSRSRFMGILRWCNKYCMRSHASKLDVGIKFPTLIALPIRCIASISGYSFIKSQPSPGCIICCASSLQAIEWYSRTHCSRRTTESKIKRAHVFYHAHGKQLPMINPYFCTFFFTAFLTLSNITIPSIKQISGIWKLDCTYITTYHWELPLSLFCNNTI
jgi:hypothetical protein